MRHFIAGGIAAGTVLLLAGCSQQTLPTSWEEHWSNAVQFLSWTQSSDGSISGTEELTLVDQDSQVATHSYPFTGTVSDGKITIKFTTSPPNTSATMTGTISADKMTLSGVYGGKPLTPELRPATAKKYQADASALEKTAQAAADAAQTQQNQSDYDAAVAVVKAAEPPVRAALTDQNATAKSEAAALDAYQVYAMPIIKHQKCISSTQYATASSLWSKLDKALTTLDSANTALSNASDDLTNALGATALATEGTAEFSSADATAATDLAKKGTSTASQSKYQADQDAQTQFALEGDLGSKPDCG